MGEAHRVMKYGKGVHFSSVEVVGRRRDHDGLRHKFPFFNGVIIHQDRSARLVLSRGVRRAAESGKCKSRLAGRRGEGGAGGGGVGGGRGRLAWQERLSLEDEPCKATTFGSHLG